MEHGELEDAASRVYYAMFHAAKALLFDRGFRPRTHKGTISMLGEHIVNKGIMDEEYADAIRKAFDLRQKSDYEPYAEIDEELVREAIENAERFIERAKVIIK